LLPDFLKQQHNEDSDLDITDHTNRVATLYQRKQSILSENKVYPFSGLKDLRVDLIEKCRKMADLWIPGHRCRYPQGLLQLVLCGPQTGPHNAGK